MKNILVTGGYGFIGSNFIHMLFFSQEGYNIINLDKITGVANLQNLADVVEQKRPERYSFEKEDICNQGLVEYLIKKHNIDTIINFAAESHVDNSINDANPFLKSNVQGTLNLLQAAFNAWLRDDTVNTSEPLKFIQVSTDEVYGCVEPGEAFTEDTPINPRNPYSATKAAADHLVMSFFHTHGLPALITRCSNNYGPFQDVTKFIPKVITHAIQDKSIPVYGKGEQRRDWLHVNDHCRGIWAAALFGVPGQVYNFGSNFSVANIEVVKMILKLMGKENNLIQYVDDRPGHDFEYRMSYDKAKDKLGWEPSTKLLEGMNQTIQFYLNNQNFWELKVNL